MRCGALVSSLSASSFEEGVESAWRRFERFGILGLLDDDPTGAGWRRLSPEAAKGGLHALELVAVERRDAREKWSDVYQILVPRAQKRSASCDNEETHEGRIEHEVCLVR